MLPFGKVMTNDIEFSATCHCCSKGVSCVHQGVALFDILSKIGEVIEVTHCGGMKFLLGLVYRVVGLPKSLIRYSLLIVLLVKWALISLSSACGPTT